MNGTLVRILLMEDDPGDVELVREALRDAKMALSIDHESGMPVRRWNGGKLACLRGPG